jgi:S-disulfanyl-L-cysteine oxidoreductase SoxD
MASHFKLTAAFLAAVVATSVSAASRITAQEPAPAPLPAASLARLVLDPPRIYTDSQATAGQAVWAKNCAECHETKDVTGADFRTKWVGQPLFTLYEQIRTTMPDGNPGSLPVEHYAATMAYILKLNGLPAGTSPLESDSAALSAVKLELPGS